MFISLIIPYYKGSQAVEGRNSGPGAPPGIKLATGSQVLDWECMNDLLQAGPGGCDEVWEWNQADSKSRTPTAKVCLCPSVVVIDVIL
jgi:hypothetical protein